MLRGVRSLTYGIVGTRVGRPSIGWSTIPSGGGGYCDGIDIAPDGTMVLRSDTLPAPYLWSAGQSAWLPLATATSMPASFVSARSDKAMGAWDIRIAPSLTSKFYMSLANAMFVTTNSGTTWAQLTSFPAQTDMGGNTSFRGYNYRMAVDPQNDAICFVGTVSGGLQRTLDSGASWTTRTVGTGAGTSGAGMLIAFDPTSSVSGSAQQGLFVGRYGDGVYHSIDGGGTFTALNTTGMPTTMINLMVDQNGKLWVVADTGAVNNIWTWTSGGGWVQNTTNPQVIHSITVDPNNAAHVVSSAGGGSIITSSDGGATWHDVHGDTTVNADSNSSWMQTHQVGGIYFITDGKILFDPVVSGKLWQAFGLGVMYASNPFASATAITFTTQEKGVESLDSTMIIHPPGGNPIGTAWDLPIWNFTSFTSSPSEYKPHSYFNGINPSSVATSKGWGIDFAKSDPTFIAAVTGNLGGVFSTDKGVNWTAFTDQSGFPSPFNGGTISASTPSNIVAMGGGLFYTLNGGTNWQAPTTFAGSSGGSGSIPSQLVAADPNNALTFLLYVSAGGTNPGIYKTTDGGVNWSRVSTFTIASEGFGPRMLGIPGQSGHFLLTGGFLDTGTPPQAAGALYRSINSGTSWAAISNVGEVWCMDYGTTVSGQSYPTIYFAGWANQGSGLTFGVWKTIDNFSTFVQLGEAHPGGTYTAINDIAGDKSVDGACSIALFGGGFKTFR